jgi:hypothetical protein
MGECPYFILEFIGIPVFGNFSVAGIEKTVISS